MTEGRARIDWFGTLSATSSRGELMALLQTLPQEQWSERASDGWSLLHYACTGPNLAALVALLRFGIDPSTPTTVTRTTAVHCAAKGQPRLLEVLCAAGANMRALNFVDCSALDTALARSESFECARILVANGVRLRTARGPFPPQLVAFERGVLCCRTVVVVLLGLKRRRGAVMRALDRFMVRAMGYAVWSTRYAKAWIL